jgi:hypothetical protein
VPAMTSIVTLEEVPIVLAILDEDPTSARIEKREITNHLIPRIGLEQTCGMNKFPGPTTSAGMMDDILPLPIEPKAPPLLGLNVYRSVLPRADDAGPGVQLCPPPCVW